MAGTWWKRNPPVPMMNQTDTMKFCHPTIEEGVEIYDLVSRCRPLDLNSRYAYLLCCRYFRTCSMTARLEGELVGFLSGLRSPLDAETLFIWQVAVAPEVRGQGVAGRLLDAVLLSNCGWVRRIETTVTPSNKPSNKLFESLAQRLDADLLKQPLFEEHLFGSEAHEEEVLYRIGPIPMEKLFVGELRDADVCEVGIRSSGILPKFPGAVYEGPGRSSLGRPGAGVHRLPDGGGDAQLRAQHSGA